MNDNEPREVTKDWTFLSNHAHVLLVLANDPEMRLRDVSDRVGITERAVQRIVKELEEAGYLQREKTGRRNRYRVSGDLPLRHPIESHRTIRDLISLILLPDERAGLNGASTSATVGSEQ